MKFPICATNVCVAKRKQTASFSIAGLMLAIAPLWLMLAAADTPAQAQTASPADWTQFLRDNMQRWNPYETVLGVNNVGNLKLKWANNLSGPSSPAVTNGVVYIGSYDNNVYALNASTGARLWSYTTGNAVSTSPAVANGVVYVGSNDGNMYALNASTGGKLWSYAAGTEVLASPAVANGTVYCQAVSSVSGNLYAFGLSGSTGALLWSYTLADRPTSAPQSSPAVANGVVYIGGNDTVYALNASTGVQLWSYDTGFPVESSPAVANGVVYIGNDNGTLYALNASTGALLWSYSMGGLVPASPAVANGVVYFPSSPAPGSGSAGEVMIHALNASTGIELWSFPIGGNEQSSPALANGVVYIGGNDTVYALNASTGAKLWSFDTEGEVGSSPVVVDGVVYIGAGDNFFAFGLGRGVGGADLLLRVEPSPTPVKQGDLLTYAFPVWNQGPDNADQEVLTTQVPAGTTFDYIRISGTPGLGTCTTPPYQGNGQIVCHENSAMAPNTTWTVRLVVQVTASSGSVLTESGTVTEDTFDPNLANNTATVSTTVQ